MTLRRQFVRYALVGVASNGLCYLLYLGLTAVGMGHKLAMSTLYAVATAQTFIANRNWTFGDDGRLGAAFVRYVLLYLFGYLLQLVLLVVGVDMLGWPHQWVMLGGICCVALLLFCGQKWWVFRQSAPASLTT